MSPLLIRTTEGVPDNVHCRESLTAVPLISAAARRSFAPGRRWIARHKQIPPEHEAVPWSVSFTVRFARMALLYAFTSRTAYGRSTYRRPTRCNVGCELQF